MRSIDPSKARDFDDAQHRKQKRQKVLGQLEELTEMPKGALPDFLDNWDKGSRTGIRIPADQLDQVVWKWTRGAYFKTQGQLISAETEIDINLVPEEEIEEAFADLWEHVDFHIRSPGIKLLEGTAQQDNKHGAIYAFLIWDKFHPVASFIEGE